MLFQRGFRMNNWQDIQDDIIRNPLTKKVNSSLPMRKDIMRGRLKNLDIRNPHIKILKHNPKWQPVILPKLHFWATPNHPSTRLNSVMPRGLNSPPNLITTHLLLHLGNEEETCIILITQQFDPKSIRFRDQPLT